MWGGDDYSSSSDCSSVEAVSLLEQASFQIQQSGRVEIGGKDEDGEESMRYEVTFQYPFPEPPVVFVSPEGEPGADYADVFGTTVIQETVSEEGFHVNIGRMSKGNEAGWGQNLHLNWIAVCSNSPSLQATVAEAGPKEEEGESLTVEVRYPMALPEGVKPVIYATAYGEDYPDTFAICVQKAGRHRCKLNVCRGIGGGWGQNLKLAVLVTTSLPSYQVDLGNNDGEDRDIAFRGDGDGIMFPRAPSSRRPLLFCIAQHEHGSEYPDAFISSAANITRHGFQMNVQRGNQDENGWGQNLRAQVILVP